MSGASWATVVVALFQWSPLGFALALVSGALVAYGVVRWHLRLERQGPSPGARERMAMQTAWRKGGAIRPEDLADAIGISLEEAQATLEELLRRGLCRLEEGRFVFYSA
jgi:hypothetical protein